MWLAGGAAVVLAAVVLLVATFLEDDRRGVGLRRTGAVTAEELRAADLPVSWRGYHQGHVDALLARAATTLEQVEHYGVLDEPPDPEDGDAPVRSRSVGPPSFLADAFRPSEDPSVDAATDDEGGDGPASGEELEDGRGDDTRGLDE